MAATKLRQGKMLNSLARPSLLALSVSLGVLGATPSFAAEEMDHSMMDHGKMNHGSMPGMDHGAMDHGAMDHGAMDHSTMNHGSADTPTTSRTPIPVLTDADRQAAFPPLGGHHVHDSAINSFFLLDQL
ncbi:Copper resistance protein B (fragment), partial [Pseudomonas inefficax]